MTTKIEKFLQVNYLENPDKDSSDTETSTSDTSSSSDELQKINFEIPASTLNQQQQQQKPQKKRKRILDALEQVVTADTSIFIEKPMEHVKVNRGPEINRPKTAEEADRKLEKTFINSETTFSLPEPELPMDGLRHAEDIKKALYAPVDPLYDNYYGIDNLIKMLDDANVPQFLDLPKALQRHERAFPFADKPWVKKQFHLKPQMTLDIKIYCRMMFVLRAILLFVMNGSLQTKTNDMSWIVRRWNSLIEVTYTKLDNTHDQKRKKDSGLRYAPRILEIYKLVVEADKKINNFETTITEKKKNNLEDANKEKGTIGEGSTTTSSSTNTTTNN
jgi:hypothetical protein